LGPVISSILYQKERNMTDTASVRKIKNRPKPNLFMAILPIVLTLGLLLMQLVVFEDFTPHIPLAFGIVITGLLALFRGYQWKDMEEGIFRVIFLGLQSVAILMTVGMIIGVWMLSGTVPVMIYYGLQIITPSLFLVVAMLICAIVSLATGTSWGTTGTLGIALVGIGSGLGIPMHLVGGAVVSGAFFGDKMSPLSDTTNLAPAVCGTDLFSHIKNMMATTVPAMAIAFILYFIIGLRYSADTMNAQSIEIYTSKIADTFYISPILLIPGLVVIILAMKKFPAIPTLFAGVVAGILTAILAQGASIHEIFVAMQSGYVSETGVAEVDKLLSKGGIQSMMWVTSLMIIALGFGGILERTRSMEVILDHVLTRVRNRFGIIFSSTCFSVGTNLVAGDPYLSIALPGRMFAPAYRGANLSTKNLSRSVEDGGTLISPLVPWNAGGAYVTGVLGIETLAYAPFAFACWLSPLIGLIWAFTGKCVPQASQSEKETWQKNREMIMLEGELLECTPLVLKRLENQINGISEEEELSENIQLIN
jgi:Na+:H+ antiporter, NhaC family